ncbi:hypothetical protein Sulku_1548 [Sulfuricurvum kujiense DSM 16994]|uniref:Uncharacterized protein n=1 Tax=Sulfuricurvum kujiense (strain ATCC BAA-921 / DSM 16994 / JCM 11577 / YK-1) TaxID=709032 RepID=E4TZV3_SULKY|nr:hypothetical protein [Sulfuricurvum kujiense]ADR34210.1 hypothetical protein Sulku_1548 [Sulfuricurvum kujiense DSM 16994]
MTNSELDNFLKLFYKLKEDSINARYGFDDEWDIFIKKILPLSPKSYGTKIQNRIMEKNNLLSVKANENLGDFKKDNKYFEIKTSLLTITNKIANIAGIRSKQNVDGYYVFIIDAIKYESITTYSFKLSKDNMEKELKILKAIPLNGTKEANIENNNSALRFGLPLESEHFNRWVEYYMFTTEDDIVKTL